MNTSIRQHIVAGNWKMHGSLATNHALLTGLLEKFTANNNTNKSQCIVFPPFTYLNQTSSILDKSSIQWGAQDVSQYNHPGAFTGEVSAAMLKDFGCHYVIVGHSERRTLFGETSDIAAEKFNTAQKNQLTPILCIGETLAEHKAGQAEAVLAKQLEPIKNFENCIIAYEPVWAIGTGVTATPEQAQTIHAFIRQTIAQKNPLIAEKISILYGGSVKASNAADLFAMPDIDGALVGGASLSVDEFWAIVNA